MKNESSFTKKLDAFLKRIRKAAADPPEAIDPVGQLVLGMFQWESTSSSAQTAYDRLMSNMVDHNDLRVSHPQEIKAIVGSRVSKADERIGRLLSVLQEIYIRQHAVALDELTRKPKKEVRAYLDSLPQMPRYVSAQVTLLCFSGHAVPVDEVLATLLRREKLVDPEATTEQIESFLERRIRASDAVSTHVAIRAWVDDNYASASASSKSAKTTDAAAKPRKKKTATASKTVKKKKSKKKASKSSKKK